MTIKSKKRSGVVWLLIIATAGIVCLGYFVLKPSAEGNDSEINKEISQVQPEEKSADSNQVAATGTVITTGDSEFGTMLFNDKKQAIYIWELEDSSKAECYGNCAELWPPVLTDGAPQSSGNVNNGLLGTTTRTDGSTQVTYNGHPLYYYAHEKAGEVKCHNIATHGGLWWVIQPNGNRAA